MTQSTVRQHSLYQNQHHFENDPNASDPELVEPDTLLYHYCDKLLEEFRDNLFNFILKFRETTLLHLPVQHDISDDNKFLFVFCLYITSS